MKKIFLKQFLLLMIIMFISVSCANQKEYDFEGTWKGLSTKGHDFGGKEVVCVFSGSNLDMTIYHVPRRDPVTHDFLKDADGNILTEDLSMSGTWKITGLKTDYSGKLKIFFPNAPGKMPKDVTINYKFDDDTKVYFTFFEAFFTKQ